MELPQNLPPPSDPLQREDYFEQYVEPRLLELAQWCHAHGMSFLASVQFNSSENGHGTTVLFSDDALPHFHLAKSVLLNPTSFLDEMKSTFNQERKPGVPG